MASASDAIRRTLETIALAIIVGGLLFFIRENVQFPLQFLTRASSFLLIRFCAQQWLFAAVVLMIARSSPSPEPGATCRGLEVERFPACPDQSASTAGPWTAGRGQIDDAPQPLSSRAVDPDLARPVVMTGHRAPERSGLRALGFGAAA